MSMIDSIMRQAEEHLERLNARRRETVPASELVVGVQCGGSDAFSGVTANPAVGFCTDLLVRAGATVMFSEVTEVRDGIDQLTVARDHARGGRGHDPRDGLVRRLPRQAAASTAAPTPRRATRRAGCPTSSRRRWARSSSRAARRSRACCRRARRRGQKGLIYAATPASDFICGTLQLAAGINLHVFTTGRGTPYGLAEVPVIKVATRSDLARRWHDLMDVERRPHRRRRGDHRRRGLGAVPPDARRGQRPQEDLGRALEAAQRAGAVQSGAGDLTRRNAWKT